MTVHQASELTSEQTSMFIEVVDASLRINRRDQFYNWLLSSCQYLIPHEVLICGLQAGPDHQIQYERYVSTRYLTEQHFRELTRQGGLVERVMQCWVHSQSPVYLAEDMQTGHFGRYKVPFIEPPGYLNELEIRNMLAHGICSRGGVISAFFCFSRLTGQMSSTQAYLLQLLVPHLHAALIRVMSDQPMSGVALKPVLNLITVREREILQWIHRGKTNWEIASILDISPLTVKNHVQNILRKLNVQNRSHAAVKASQLGLVQL